MNRAPLIMLGALLTILIAWIVHILIPQIQLGQASLAPMMPPTPDYPPNRPGLAAQGLQVYRSLGCAECHTQQLSASDPGLTRGWGRRRTVAQDYLADPLVTVGQLRLGPDLSNLAARKPQDYAVPFEFQSRTNVFSELQQRLYARLLNPRQASPFSIMPAYPFLFETNPKLKDAPPVPKPEARALVAYLLSLHADAPVFASPHQIIRTNVNVK